MNTHRKIILIAMAVLVVVVSFAVNTSGAQAFDFGDVHTCSITVDRSQVHAGEGVAVTWNASGFTTITVNNKSVASTGTMHITNVQEDMQFVLHATDSDGNTCDQTVHVDCLPPVVLPPTCDAFSASPSTINAGGSSTLTWATTNATSVSINQGVGAVAVDGSKSVSPTSNTTYTLTATGAGGTVTCTTTVNVQSVNPAPTCDAFSASPSTINAGGSSTLTWATTNATSVNINNGIGNVSVDGSQLINNISADITYTLTATGAGGTVTCTTTVDVQSSTPDPICDSFAASPSIITSGSSSTLTWNTTNATSVSINQGVGTVAVDGSKSVSPTSNTTYTLTATGANGHMANCTTTVTVTSPTVFSCTNNVNFTASDYSIRKGSSTTLTWSTTNVDSLNISVIDKTALSGSQSVSPNSDTTYVLTAKRGNETINCPLTIDVSSGGGGGSVVPSCDLTVSKSKVSSGDTVKLTWDTRNADEVILKDDKGKVLFTTEDYRSSEKDNYFDYSLKVTPTRDTKYTLVVERGSRDEECSVKVKVGEDGSVTLLQDRDQQPLVAGIALSNVPYTGFEAGLVLTIAFYALLVAWALYITYILVARKRAVSIGNVASLAGFETANMVAMNRAVAIRPDAFVSGTTTSAPANLPAIEEVKEDSVVAASAHQIDMAVATELENRAHANRALLSSDAIRYFVGAVAVDDRVAQIDRVISEAHKMYPLEEGWVVINEDRMRALITACDLTLTVPTVGFAPTVVPEGTGSLAEAIVTGNIVAAYDLLGNRPMFALADAAADLDALYRKRKGGAVSISGLLERESSALTDEKILSMIEALTSALDGVYQDEASAVKMAIMKAVKMAA